MAKPKRTHLAPGLSRLERLALPALYPPTTGTAKAWRYTIVVPFEQIKPARKPKASLRDLNDLRRTFVRHFGGVTPLPATPGYGLRDPGKPDHEPEYNVNRAFVVYSTATPAADRYFRMLQRLLQRYLEEGVILVEKLRVTLL
jgi:hypothetical protein